MSSQTQGLAPSTKRFSEKDRKTIESSEFEQCQLKEWVASSEKFSEAEKAAIKVNTVDEFSIFWEQNNSAKEAFDRRHEKGCGLWAKRYQNSAVLIQDFMNDFSPIVEIVKNFAAPYGGVAVATMSILFTVAAKKAEQEKRLMSTISAIKDRLPAQIVAVYQGFMDFCIVATKYYKGCGPRRWLRVLGAPDNLVDKSNKVQDGIVSIRRLCEELLDKNVDSIKKLSKGLKDQVRELQNGHDSDRLNEVQRLLKPDDYSEEKQQIEWDNHRQAVLSDDQLNAEPFQRMHGPELDSFQGSKDYRSWIQSEHSCLLILSGCNNESISHIDHCWLSPIALAGVKDLRQQGSSPIYANYVFPREGKLLYNVLPILLLQLLRQKRHALRDEKQYAELCTELRKLQQDKDLTDKDGVPEYDRIDALEKVALRVISFFDKSETVYIIVDRADRCRDVGKVDHRKALLKAFVKMVEAARSKLKILTVIDGNSWRMESHRDELGERMKERVIAHTAEQRYA
ncbi:hypothetical protein MMC30_001950 [Trapelia coarctata]|nr:hypothetical protein [Trapelia coarctata]